MSLPEPTPTRHLPWRRALTASASGMGNLLVAGGAQVGAAASHSGAVLALGLAAYLALIAWDLASPEHWRAVIRGARPDALPEPRALRSEEGAKLAGELRAARAELSRVVGQSPEPIARYLELALTSVPELEAAAGRLLARLEDLSTYLGGADGAAVQAEVQDLEWREQQASDPEAKAQLAQAREAKAQHARTLQELEAARERVRATLARLAATYRALPSRVVHMRTLDAQAMDALSGDVNDDLDRMNHEVAAFEETLRTVGNKVRT